MKDQILKKAKETAIRAKANSDNGYSEKVTVTLSSGNENSLNKSIKTEEQGRLFMSMLKSL